MATVAGNGVPVCLPACFFVSRDVLMFFGGTAGPSGCGYRWVAGCVWLCVW